MNLKEKFNKTADLLFFVSYRKKQVRWWASQVCSVESVAQKKATHTVFILAYVSSNTQYSLTSIII